MGEKLEMWRVQMIDSPEQRGTRNGTEGGPLCAGPVESDILEGTNWNHLCQKDRQKQPLGE